MALTRIAPTPSGYLHVGNAVNFQLVSWLATAIGARIALRIDDFDAARYRRAYVDDIFAVLDWLQIDCAIGPSTTAEFEAHFSLRRKREHYRAALDSAMESGLDCYACACSRRALAAGAACTCRGEGRVLVEGDTALRVHVPHGTVVRVGERQVHLDRALGDFVLWRRDGLPAYQLASVIEDRDIGVTHVVRGADLLDSTAAQLFIAPALQAHAFANANFVHHGLISGADGHKLSKSALQAGPMERTADLRRLVLQAARDLADQSGLPVP